MFPCTVLFLAVDKTGQEQKYILSRIFSTILKTAPSTEMGVYFDSEKKGRNIFFSQEKVEFLGFLPKKETHYF